MRSLSPVATSFQNQKLCLIDLRLCFSWKESERVKGASTHHNLRIENIVLPHAPHCLALQNGRFTSRGPALVERGTVQIGGTRVAALAGTSSVLRLLVLLAVLGEAVAIFLIVGSAASALFLLGADAHPGDALGCRAVSPAPT